MLKNKLDEARVVRNKAKLVSKGYNLKERIDYDDTFAPIARLGAIRLLTFASVMEINLYQMDAKCAFLYGYLPEEVYIKQSLCLRT